jgi:hypothetical protein
VKTLFLSINASKNKTCVSFPAETAVNIAYSCNILEDEMDGVFTVKGKDSETIRQELRYMWDSGHSQSLNLRFITHIYPQCEPHITRRNREEMKDGKQKNP